MACSDTCCCNACQARLPINLRCCCSCFCERICVTIALDDTGTADTDCDCILIRHVLIYDCDTKTWRADISCGALTVDLEFEFKTCNDKCYLCLTSTCLGLTGACPSDDCLEFSPGSLFCNSLENTGTGTVRDQWAVDFSSCQDADGTAVCGGGTISVVCSDDINPFGCPGTGTGTDLRCNDCKCPGCECVCRCICVQYEDDRCPTNQTCPQAQESEVCYDRESESWKVEYACDGDTIDLEFKLIGIDCSDNTGTGTAPCEMVLISNFYGISIDNPAPAITESIVNPQAETCPDLNHDWTFNIKNNDTNPPGMGSDNRNVQISIRCLSCPGVCAETSECCDNRLWPAQLTAGIEVLSCSDPPLICCGGEPTGTSPAAIGDSEIVLTFQGVERRGDPFPDPDFNCAAKYTGSGTWCGQPASITLYLCDRCQPAGTNGSTLEISICAITTCTPPQDACDCTSGLICDPIDQTFDFTITIDGETCEMRVEITE